jgi:hypothetical protein
MDFKSSAKFLTIMSLSIFTSIASAQDKPIDEPQKVTNPKTADELKMLQLIREKLESNELLLNDIALATLAFRLTSQSGKITEAMCDRTRKNDPIKLSKGLVKTIKDSADILVEFGQLTAQYASEVTQRVDLKADSISRNKAIIDADCDKKFTI